MKLVVFDVSWILH